MMQDDDNNEQYETREDEALTGSDEMLSSDDLRLPPGANMLVRLHAVRAWLERRRKEAALEAGQAALLLQDVAQVSGQRPRRRAMQQEALLSRAQQSLLNAQEQASAFEEALALLEESIAHTAGERTLVEYYLALEERMLERGFPPLESAPIRHTPWFDAMVDVLRRVEHVGIPEEE